MISIIRAAGREVISFQLLSVVIAATIAGVVWESDQGYAALFGGGISIVNLLWLQWRLRRSEKRETVEKIEQDAEGSARKIAADLYMAAAERLILAVSLFLFGLVKMQLDPMTLMAGFVVGQLAMLAASQRLGTTRQ